MITREKEVAFMDWVKENCPDGENSEFFDLLKTKLSGLDDRSLELFINSVRNQVATNTVITSYQQSNQVKWNIYSFIIINDLANDLLYGKKSLMDIITNLAKERHYIALDLGHGQLHWRDQFGAVRGVDSSPTEACYEHILKQDTVFSYLFNPISKEIDKLIDANFLTEITEEQMFEDTMAGKLLWSNDWSAEKKLVLVNDLPNKSDGMCVLVRKNREDNTTEAIGITYPTIEEKNIQTHVQELQPLFDKILELNPKNEGDLKNFLMALGELSYHLYRLLPVRQGNSAVVDWIIRGIAESKQI